MSSQFPIQKLTSAEKEKQYGSVKAWCLSIINSVDTLYSGMGYNMPNEISNMQDLYNLRAGKLLTSDYQNVLNELGFPKTEAFPVQLKNYPIIFQLCNTLLGEEQNRPSNERVVQTNPDVVSVADAAKQAMLMQYFEATLHNEMLASGLIKEGEEEQAQTPEEIERYMNMTYRDTREVMGQQSLEYIKMFCETKRKLDKGFDDLITQGREIFYVGSYSNEPFLRKCNLLFVDFDRSPDIEFLQDCAWVREIEYLSSPEVYDRYRDELTDEDVERIESMKGSLSQQGSSGYGVPFYYNNNNDNGNSTSTDNYIYNSSTVVKVTHISWKSLRKIAIVTSIDLESGAEIKHMEDETYKKQPNDVEVKWEWVNEAWEATKIGDDIIVNYGPRPNQNKSIDNPSICKLPYVGITYNRLTSNTDYSVVSMLRSYQYLFNVTMYRYEHMMSLAKGKAILFDIAQIPKSFGFDVDKWIYYLTTANIAFVNSMEEDKKGQRSAFNNFTVLDMTLSNSIQYLITTLDSIKQAAGDLVGITPQRMGQISSQELVGNVQQGVQNSTNVTEYLFSAHATVKRDVMAALLEEAKWCWREGKKANYILDDMTRCFLKIDGDVFANCNYGVFVSNAVSDTQMFNSIKGLAQSAMQNGQATLSGIAKLMRNTSPTAIIKSLEEMEQKLQQQQAQQADAQNQSAMQLEQARAEEGQKERDLKYLIAQESNQTKIIATEITSLGFSKTPDSDESGTPDVIEVAKLELDKQRIAIEESKVKLGLIKDTSDRQLKREQMGIDKAHDQKKLEIEKLKAKSKPSTKKS